MDRQCFLRDPDVGREREINEDNFITAPSEGLFVVCDGMGGHAAGEVASQVATQSLVEHVGRHRDMIEEYLCGDCSKTRLNILDMLQAGANAASTRAIAFT